MSVVQQCRQWLHLRASVPQSPKALAADLERWAKTPLGQAILQEERASLDELLRYRFGYHLCCFSHLNEDLSRESRINHKINMVQLSVQTGEGDVESDVESDVAGGVESVVEFGANDGPNHEQCQDPQFMIDDGCSGSKLPFDGCRLPLASDSVDVLLLHHCVEFSANPHELLREAQRVLIDHGHLIITSFNPLSGYGLFANVARFLQKKPMWQRRLLTASATRDWLQLLGLEPLQLKPHFYRPPVSHKGFLSSSAWVEKLGLKLGALNWGASFTLVARNDVFVMNAIKPRWQKQKQREQFASASIGRQAKHSELKLVGKTTKEVPPSIK